MAETDEVVRSYLTALRDPGALRDDDAIAELETADRIERDPIERLQLRQQVLDAKAPQVKRYEDEFVTHAKACADEHGVTGKAFAARASRRACCAEPASAPTVVASGARHSAPVRAPASTPA
jgi:hypothetical protein